PVIDNDCIAAIADTLINTLHLIRKKDDKNKETESLFANAYFLNSSDNNVSEEVNDAYGRILHKNVYSKYNVPSFRTSKKHGYAVLFPPISLQCGTCVWVKSGAPIPNEATAVVEEKNTKRIRSLLNNDKVYIEILSKPQYGQNINPIGHHMTKNKLILKRSTRIGPEEMGVLAASGHKEVVVIQQLSIGVLSIGNNLEEPGKPLKPGYIYDISRIIMISLLKNNDFSSSDFGIVNNTSSSIKENIEKALDKVDILVTLGCANDKDLLKKILLEYFHAEIYFGNVNIKPGKSTTLATCKINDKIKYCLCLSGNPVTAFIIAQALLLPFLKNMSGNEYAEIPILPIHVNNPFILHHRPRLACTYLKWSKDNVATACSMGNLFKDKLYNIVGSNALLILPIVDNDINSDNSSDPSDENIDINNIHNDIRDVLSTQAVNVQIFDMIVINPVETDITTELFFTCTEADVILIIGDNKSVNKQLVKEAIESVSDNQEVSKRVTRSLLNIETSLNENFMPHKTVFGIRNQTLIIDLSGLHKNTKKCFVAIANMILQTIYLIRIDKDENIPLHDIASTSSDNFTMEKEVKTAVKRHRKSYLFPKYDYASTIKRHKESFPMISITDALCKIREIISENKNKIIFETVQLNDAYGRILYENVESTYNFPPFNTSTKHGYAVLITDGKGIRKVLQQDEKNTFSPMTLEPGTCVWINSGDPVPNEATAVVQLKDIKLVKKLKDSDEMYIEILIQPQFNENIKPVGYELMKGKTVATPYTRIGPLEIGLLAASGRKEVIVIKNTPIGVLSIGNNLGEPGEILTPGFTYDINRITLITLLKEQGYNSLDFGIVNNLIAPIKNKIDEALKKVDILVTTGSTNNRDLMKIILEEYYKADIHFGNVNIKPGKSTIFATCEIDNTKKYFWCLSGNPVSAVITARIFLLTFLNEMYFNFYTEYAIIPASMESEYILHSRSRATWTTLGWTSERNCALVRARGNAISDKLISAIGANAILMLPKKEDGKVILKSFTQALLIKIPNIKCFNNDFTDLNEI
ncbi:GEPH protein, partial [Acromyrmex charruanus]